jgi:hypothetical protein
MKDLEEIVDEFPKSKFTRAIDFLWKHKWKTAVFGGAVSAEVVFGDTISYLTLSEYGSLEATLKCFSGSLILGGIATGVGVYLARGSCFIKRFGGKVKNSKKQTLLYIGSFLTAGTLAVSSEGGIDFDSHQDSYYWTMLQADQRPNLILTEERYANYLAELRDPVLIETVLSDVFSNLIAFLLIGMGGTLLHLAANHLRYGKNLPKLLAVYGASLSQDKEEIQRRSHELSEHIELAELEGALRETHSSKGNWEQALIHERKSNELRQAGKSLGVEEVPFFRYVYAHMMFNNTCSKRGIELINSVITFKRYFPQLSLRIFKELELEHPEDLTYKLLHYQVLQQEELLGAEEKKDEIIDFALAQGIETFSNEAFQDEFFFKRGEKKALVTEQARTKTARELTLGARVVFPEPLGLRAFNDDEAVYFMKNRHGVNLVDVEEDLGATHEDIVHYHEQAAYVLGLLHARQQVGRQRDYVERIAERALLFPGVDDEASLAHAVMKIIARFGKVEDVVNLKDHHGENIKVEKPYKLAERKYHNLVVVDFGPVGSDLRVYDLIKQTEQGEYHLTVDEKLKVFAAYNTGWTEAGKQPLSCDQMLLHHTALTPVVALSYALFSFSVLEKDSLRKKFIANARKSILAVQELDSRVEKTLAGEYACLEQTLQKIA